MNADVLLRNAAVIFFFSNHPGTRLLTNAPVTAPVVFLVIVCYVLDLFHCSTETLSELDTLRMSVKKSALRIRPLRNLIV